MEFVSVKYFQAVRIRARLSSLLYQSFSFNGVSPYDVQFPILVQKKLTGSDFSKTRKDWSSSAFVTSPFFDKVS